MLARWQSTITDDAGNIVPNAMVEVRREGFGQPLIQLFADRQGSNPLGNPIQADSDGFVSFHVHGGSYRITATSSGFQRVWRFVPIGTAQEFDVENLGSFLQAGIAPFATLAELNAFTPEAVNVGGVVFADPDPANNGWYTWDGDNWNRARGFPDSVVRLIVTGGDPNSIEAETAEGVDPASVQMFFLIPEADNTGSIFLSINGDNRLLKGFHGDHLGPGFLQANRPVMVIDGGDDWLTLIDFRFEGLAAEAEAAKDAAVAAQMASESASTGAESHKDDAEAARDAAETFAASAAAAAQPIYSTVVALGLATVPVEVTTVMVLNSDVSGGLAVYDEIAGPIGGPNIVSNPEFFDDAIWVKGAGWTITPGIVNPFTPGFAQKSGGGASSISIPVLFRAPKLHLWEIEFFDVTNGSASLQVTGLVTLVTVNENGTFTGSFTTNESAASVLVTGGSTFAGKIRRVYFGEVAGQVQSADNRWWKIRG